MKYFLPQLVPVLLSLAVPATAEPRPGYCVELLPYAGYTITNEIVMTDNGFVPVDTPEEEFSLGRVTEYETDAEVLWLVKTMATETYLAQKDGRVYLIAQIDMDTPEPFCARQPLK